MVILNGGRNVLIKDWGNSGMGLLDQLGCDREQRPMEEIIVPDSVGQGNFDWNAAQVIELVNEERAKAGLRDLEPLEGLSNAAQQRAAEIAEKFSHTRPDGSSFSAVISQNGIAYQGSGENIAYGQTTPEQVMKDWMNSQGHRANILNSQFTSIGVGYYQSPDGTGYWTQLFTY